MDQPSVSVVIPTRGRSDLLPAVVAPLLADASTREVIVVVDGVVDASLAILQRLERREPRLKPVAIPNRGANAARQAGVERATGEIVLLIDDDVVAMPGLASGHARRHADASRVVVVGYMPVMPGPSVSDGFAARLYSDAYEARCLAYERDPQAVLRNLWAGNVSLRRSDCLEVGLVHGDFTGGYHADRDFGLRCLKAGLTGVFDRSLRGQHLYRRGVEGFASDARSQGATLLLVHQRHRDVLGVLDAESYFLKGLPRPAVTLMTTCRRPRARRMALTSLSVILRASGTLGLLKVQTLAARLLRRIEQQHGAFSAPWRREPASVVLSSLPAPPT